MSWRHQTSLIQYWLSFVAIWHQYVTMSYQVIYEKYIYIYIYIYRERERERESETIASETDHHWFWNSPTFLGFICFSVAMQSSDTMNTAFRLSWTDGQMSLKIGVALNFRYSHHKLVWTFRSIGYIAINLITFKDPDWIQCAVAGYTQQLVIGVAKIASQQLWIEARYPPKYAHISLTYVLTIIFISNNWLWLNYKLVCLGPLEALGASAIARELVSLFTPRLHLL